MTLALFEGLRGVDDEIHHDLGEPRHVGLDGRERIGEFVDDDGFVGGRGFEQRAHVLDEIREIDGLDVQGFFTRVGEHLVRERSRAVGCGLDALQARSHRGVLGQVDQREARISEDRRQQVVEIVSDAARHETQALEFLSFLNSPFQTAMLQLGQVLLGDVLLNGNKVGNAAFVVV